MYKIVHPFEDKPRRTAICNMDTGCLFHSLVTYGIDGITIFRFEMELDGHASLSCEVEVEMTPYMRRAAELGVDHNKYTSKEFRLKFGMGIVVKSFDIEWCNLDLGQIRQVKQEFINFYNANLSHECSEPSTGSAVHRDLSFNPKQLNSNHWTTFEMPVGGCKYVWPE